MKNLSISIFVSVFIFSVTFAVPTFYIFPPEGYENEKLFDMADIFYNLDDRNRVFFNLREKFRSLGYDLKTTSLDSNLKDFAGLIVCERPVEKKLKILENLSKEKIVLLLLEPPSVAPHYYNKEYHNNFGKIFIMLDDWVDNEKYIKFHFPQTSLKKNKNNIPFEQKKLCTLIAGNKGSYHPDELYSERRRIINFFEKVSPYDFDLYGRGWSNKINESYRGFVTLKKDIYQYYKFCICYENIKKIQGYITEKIFDAFINGVIPVYWGAENITTYIPENCFIDRRKFLSDWDLYIYLKTMNRDTFEKYQSNIANFLESKDAQLFSQEYFIEQIISGFDL